MNYDDMRRYRLDHDWLWDAEAGSEGLVATLRLVVSDGDTERAEDAVNAWITTLRSDEHGSVGADGWNVAVVNRSLHSVTLDFTSSGRDVAKNIADAADRAYAALGDGHELDLLWMQLPLRP